MSMISSEGVFGVRFTHTLAYSVAIQMYFRIFTCVFVFYFWCCFFDSIGFECIDRCAFLMSQYLVQSKYQNVDAIAFGSFGCAVREYIPSIWYLIRSTLTLITICYTAILVVFFYDTICSVLCIASMLPMLYACDSAQRRRWWWLWCWWRRRRSRRRWNAAIISVHSVCCATIYTLHSS